MFRPPVGPNGVEPPTEHAGSRCEVYCESPTLWLDRAGFWSPAGIAKTGSRRSVPGAGEFDRPRREALFHSRGREPHRGGLLARCRATACRRLHGTVRGSCQCLRSRRRYVASSRERRRPNTPPGSCSTDVRPIGGLPIRSRLPTPRCAWAQHRRLRADGVRVNGPPPAGCRASATATAPTAWKASR